MLAKKPHVRRELAVMLSWARHYYRMSRDEGLINLREWHISRAEKLCADYKAIKLASKANKDICLDRYGYPFVRD